MQGVSWSRVFGFGLTSGKDPGGTGWVRGQTDVTGFAAPWCRQGEGFLRSEVSLIQTIGRAARNAEGRVVLYADNITKSIEKAVGETRKRRAMQEEYNKEHGIIPKTIDRKIAELEEFKTLAEEGEEFVSHEASMSPAKLQSHIKDLRKEMLAAAANLEFERAAKLRDKIKVLEQSVLDLL